MSTIRFGKRLIMGAVGLAAAAACGVYTGSPAEGIQQEEYYVISHGRDIAIVSSEDENVDELVARYGYDAGDFILDVSERDGYTAVTLFDAMDVSVTADGQTRAVRASGGTVEQLLRELDVELGEEDVVSHRAEDEVYDGLSVHIYRVTYGEEYVDEAVEHGVRYVDSAELYKGTEKTVTEGSDGVKRVYYTVRYVDGAEESREVSREEILTEAVDTVIERGTKEKPAPKKETAEKKASENNDSGKKSSSQGGSGSSGTDKSVGHSVTVGEGTITTDSGTTYNYTRVISMKATAYSYAAGAMTSSGAPAQVGIVAALPGTIPQGTRVYIVTEDGKYTYGPAVVGDVPGGDIIDLFYETEAECDRFGVRQAKVYILD